MILILVLAALALAVAAHIVSVRRGADEPRTAAGPLGWGTSEASTSLVSEVVLNGVSGVAPSGTAKSEAPAGCAARRLTAAPVDLDKVYAITPLGKVNPPWHTLPTEHLNIHLSPGDASEKVYPLYAAGDMTITGVGLSLDQLAPGRLEYRIDFSLCDGLSGYYNHVKELSANLASAIEKIECEDWIDNFVNVCLKRLSHKVLAGALLGGVGHFQGNFDFGLRDKNAALNFINKTRYENDHLSLKVVCPLDYFSEDLKQAMYGKIKRTAAPRCGEVMHDAPGTIQGNWFFGLEAKAQINWNEQLAMVYDSEKPGTALISMAGIFTEPALWAFEPKNEGLVNRRFSEVRADGKTYCYEKPNEGRILVQLSPVGELTIERQTGDCAGNFSFVSPMVYAR